MLQAQSSQPVHIQFKEPGNSPARPLQQFEVLEGQRIVYYFVDYGHTERLVFHALLEEFNAGVSPTLFCLLQLYIPLAGLVEGSLLTAESGVFLGCFGLLVAEVVFVHFLVKY